MGSITEIHTKMSAWSWSWPWLCPRAAAAAAAAAVVVRLAFLLCLLLAPFWRFALTRGDARRGDSPRRDAVVRTLPLPAPANGVVGVGNTRWAGPDEGCSGRVDFQPAWSARVRKEGTA